MGMYSRPYNGSMYYAGSSLLYRGSVGNTTLTYDFGAIKKVYFNGVKLSSIIFNGGLMWEAVPIELFPAGQTAILASTVASGWALGGNAPGSTYIVYYLLPSGDAAIGTLLYNGYTPYGSNIIDVTSQGTVRRLCKITGPGATTDWSFVVWQGLAISESFNSYTGVTTPASYTWRYVGVNSVGKLRSGYLNTVGGAASNYTTAIQVVNAATVNDTFSIVGTVPSLRWANSAGSIVANTYDAATNIGIKFY